MRAGIEHWKAQGLDFSRVFHAVQVSTPLYQTEEQDHALGHALDHQLIDRSKAAIERGEKVSVITPGRNTNRSIGAMLSAVVGGRYGPEGLPDDNHHIQFNGDTDPSLGHRTEERR